MTFHKINDYLKILVENERIILFFRKISVEIGDRLPIDILNLDESIVLNDFFNKSQTFEDIYFSLKKWVDGAYQGNEIPSTLALNILDRLTRNEHPTALNLLKTLIINEFNSGDISKLKFIFNNNFFKYLSNKEIEEAIRNNFFYPDAKNNFLQYLSNKEMEDLIRKNYSSPKTKIDIRRLIQEIIAFRLRKQFSDKEMSFTIRGGYYDGFIEGLEIRRKSANPIKNSGDIFGLEFLSQLTNIHLANFLTVNIKKLEKLENLISISLANCRILEFPDFSKLIYVSLVGCKITEFPDFSRFGKLKILKLYANNIKQIDIKDLEELEELHLGQNEISEIKGITNLKNLKKLILSENDIKSIENLNGLINLEELNLSSNKIEKLEGLDGLINLKRIDLMANKLNFIHGGIPLNIEDLLLSSNQIQEIKGLSALKKLRTLHVDHNNLAEKRKLELKKQHSNLNLHV